MISSLSDSSSDSKSLEPEGANSSLVLLSSEELLSSGKF